MGRGRCVEVVGVGEDFGLTLQIDFSVDVGSVDGDVAEARALRNRIDIRALPILLPALTLDRTRSPWRTPLTYWWAAKRGRY